MALDIFDFMKRASRLTGVPGYEGEIGDYFANLMSEYADEVKRDARGNTIARLGKGGPRVMLCAHHDEVGMVVTAIEDDGCLRIHRNGGVDPRILPGMEVSVLAKDGPVYGVIGAKPPHLLNEADRNSTAKFEDLYVDIGYCAETARRKVRVGDMVVMLAKPIKLADGCMACKTLDDRASVASMLIAMEMLKRMNVPAEAYFVASSQEETGGKGAVTSAYSVDPDFAIVVDVTHAEGPGTGKWEAFPIEKMTIVSGPNLHPMLTKMAEKCADKWRIPYTREICSGLTGTDAAEIQVSRGGVPTILLSIPLRYMHTTVETGKTDVVYDVGRLMALFIDDVVREWEDLKWY